MSGNSAVQQDPPMHSVCAILTPPGRGAVAVVGLLGPTAEAILGRCFQPANGKDFSECQLTVVYGLWRDTREDLVVLRRTKLHFEIHCHGGSSAPAAVIDSLKNHSAEAVSAAEFQDWLSDKWTVQTQFALAQATTARTAKILLRQTAELPQVLLKLDTDGDTSELSGVSSVVDDLLKWADFGIHLTRPRSIVFCGHPNVGKSSLVNRIVGFQRAIVHDLPGTTRDVVTQHTAIDGWPVKLKDTAGLRKATNPVEEIGIGKAKSEIQSANLRICVFDINQPWSATDQALLESVRADLVVFNKADLASNAGQPDSTRPPGVLTSAETGQGIEDLVNAIKVLLVPKIPDKRQRMPVTEEQKQYLLQWRTETTQKCTKASDEP